jgi:hypothetical protein
MKLPCINCMCLPMCKEIYKSVNSISMRPAMAKLCSNCRLLNRYAANKIEADEFFLLIEINSIMGSMRIQSS